MTIYIKSEENGWEVERQIDLPDDEKLVRSIMRSIKNRMVSPKTAGGVLSQRLRRTSQRRNASRMFRRTGPRRRMDIGVSCW